VPVAQVDYAAEISSIRASGADSAYVFLPGAGGIAFVKQFANSGLANRVKLYSGSWMADELTFGGIGDAALSLNLVANWFADLDTPANKTFTEAFQKEHGRKPALYAAFVYDSIFALDKAISAVKGEVGDKEGLRTALRAADFPSTRGKLKFGNNQFPIQDFYAAQVIKKEGVLQHQVVARIAENHQDRFHQHCPMK
jgi:branched-chain amino acid transport system substrate-binding protein